MTVSVDPVAAITSHHAELAEALTGRVDALVTAARAGAVYDEPVAQLRQLLVHDIVPHARAEEDALYAVFLGHVRRENELLLPALATNAQVDLQELLRVMEQRFAAHRQRAEAA